MESRAGATSPEPADKSRKSSASKIPISWRSNCLIYVLVASLSATSLVFAQPVPSGAAAGPKTMSHSARERRKALEEESVQRQRRREEWSDKTLQAVEARDRKRADCRRQAKEQNLHLMKRVRFVRKCMASASPQ